MKHASDTNRKDRKRKDRRHKFNEDRIDRTILNSDDSLKMDFSNLTKEEIQVERKRIHNVFVKRRKRTIVILTSVFVLLIVGISLLYSKTGGFEYW